MTVEFEDQVLARIESPLLKAAAIHLQELFFPGNSYDPRAKVTVQMFQRVLRLPVLLTAVAALQSAPMAAV